ncbi:uncharacterized protein EV154DRAFT_479782 [Mucor mucedo]|uniref:uncharacterized protein n=1 Tax=Mucor mucedo TaxID=29922 RepID=UPI00221FF7A4|nr:uncharacterized protein EV154DRAFT_479782 [Mucor mucedo]KAI7892876.1 hypothetical protein EV154DRAFT_479782 [Mucor mucedo]
MLGYFVITLLKTKSRNDVERFRTLSFNTIRGSTCNKNTFACLNNIVCGWQDCLVVTNKGPSLLLKAVHISIQHIFGYSDIPDKVIDLVLAQLTDLEGVPVTSEQFFEYTS